MGTFVGLDVSLKATSICVLDESGTRVFEGKAATDPAVLARLIRKRAPEVVRVGLESGPTSAWLFHALTAAGVPAICLDARHAQAALSVRPERRARFGGDGPDGLVPGGQGQKRDLSRTQGASDLQTFPPDRPRVANPGKSDPNADRRRRRSGQLPYVDFFTANIRNPNTRRAYARACGTFLDWRETRGRSVGTIRPFDVSTYIESRAQTHSART